MKVSSSSLTTFESCPKMYEAKYLLEYVEPYSERGRLGTAFHETMSSIYEKQMFDLEDVLKTYHELRTEFEMISDVVWSEGFPLIQRWYAGVVGRKWLVKPKLCEHKFEFEMASNLVISGRIDLVIVVGDKTYIIDWKTARGRPNIDKLRASPQLMFYSLACKKIFDIDGIPILYYVRSGDAYSFEYQIPDYRKLLDRTLRMQTIVESGKFEAIKNDACRYCPLHEDCETRKQRKRRTYK